MENLLVTTMEHHQHADAVPVDNIRLCRICFAKDCKMYSMTSSTVLNEAYETLTGIMTADEEHLPRYLCTECADQLMNCTCFRRRSLRAHLMLLDIVRRHGQITVELIKSVMASSDPVDNPNKDLEEVHKLTDTECDTKRQMNNVDDNHIDSEDGTNNVAVSKCKTETDEDSDNQEDLSTCSDNLQIEIIPDNDVTNQDDLIKTSVCSYDSENKMVVNVNTKNVFDIINKDIVNDGLTSNNSLVYSVNENNVNNVVKMEYCDELNGDSPEFEQSFSDDMENKHALISAIEVVPDDPLKIDTQQTPEADGGTSTDDMLRCDICPYKTDSDIQLQKHLKAHAASEDVLDDLSTPKDKVTKTPRDVNEVKIDKQQTPEADGPSTDDTLRCDICPYQIDSDIQLLEHLKAHAASKKRFHCDMCDYKTDRKDKLIRHLRTHLEKSYSCDVCNQVFTQKVSLQSHNSIHSNEKPYSCDVCNKMFGRKDNLQKHKLIHSGVKPYSCNICSKVFTQNWYLQYHKLIHSNEKRYSCDVCNKMFTLKGHLQRHQLIHSNEKSHSCDVCHKMFRLKEHLQRHQLIHSNEKSYSCDVCKKMFKRKDHLQKHLLIHSGVKPYFCDICSKVFTQKGSLQQHKLIHEKSYSCDVCNKMFRRKDKLQQHLFIHSGVKPYSCDICSKVFTQNWSLQCHKLIHSNEKPYSCDVCNKMFRLKGTLQKHQLIHSGVKPYSCNVCSKVFRQGAHLRIHQLIHSGKKPYLKK